MTDMPEEVRQARLTGERAEFFAHDTTYVDTIFADGESPLKHARNIELVGCAFQWKYPLWYAKDITARGCTWFEMGRAGVWYTSNILVEDSTIEAPKNFRRCTNVALHGVDLTHAEETLWNCRSVTLDNVVVRGDYLAMNCEGVTASIRPSTGRTRTRSNGRTTMGPAPGTNCRCGWRTWISAPRRPYARLWHGDWSMASSGIRSFLPNGTGCTRIGGTPGTALPSTRIR